MNTALYVYWWHKNTSSQYLHLFWISFHSPLHPCMLARGYMPLLPPACKWRAKCSSSQQWSQDSSVGLDNFVWLPDTQVMKKGFSEKTEEKAARSFSQFCPIGRSHVCMISGVSPHPAMRAAKENSDQDRWRGGDDGGTDRRVDLDWFPLGNPGL